MKMSMSAKVINTIALILLIFALIIPTIGFDFIYWTLYDLMKLNVYYLGVVFLIFTLAFFGFFSKKCSLIAGLLLLLLLLFFSMAKMHSPEYLLGYWLLFLTSALLIFSSFIRR
ncbi:MAG: hypothetical protein QXM06_06655 [Archaeoglobaceae archaeon]